VRQPVLRHLLPATFHTMHILVSNDDGILAPGLALLAEACATVAKVTVVAPDREQSGTSHSLTLHRPLRPQRRPDGAYQVDGTPTDCVLLALGSLMPEGPTLVFSGVNHGPNMGEDVLYSGTVAVAMEAVTLGVPGIAISFSGSDPETMASYRGLLADLVGRITRVKDFPADTLLNINLPRIPASLVKGIKVTKLGSRFFSESLTKMKDPWGREIFWIGGGTIHWTGGDDTDHQAVNDGYISITPLHMDLTNYPLFETVRGWALEG
jgi:5'-nucleotidase